MQFSNLGLIKPILKALAEKGYSTPTEIQQKAIPQVLRGRDLLACAQTGTGKTAAFAIPLIQIFAEEQGRSVAPRSMKALIVTPTRELAIQIEDNIRLYSKHTNLRHAVIFGGVSQEKQIRRMKRGVDILVATPGRLLDLAGQGHISFDSVSRLVLDEADRMLDMGFVRDIQKLLKLLPPKRQTLFFSATMPDSIKSLTKKILHNPVEVSAHVVSSAAETVQQRKYYTNKSSKKDLLYHVLNEEDLDQVLLFTRTKRGADRIARDLKKKRIESMAIHGDKSQGQRQKALDNFKKGKLRVLVATDIAARGIDIDKLECVINYDVPEVPETYVHRIGRTGRAGENGLAISIVEPEENASIKAIEKLISRRISLEQEHPFPQTEKPMTASEKKEWNKEKARRRQAFHSNRRKARAMSR